MTCVFGTDPDPGGPEGLGRELSDPGDESLQRLVSSWSRLPLGFAVLTPVVWIVLAFSEDMRKDLPVVTLVVTYAGLALIAAGQRSGRRALTRAGFCCYPLAFALCLLLPPLF